MTLRGIAAEPEAGNRKVVEVWTKVVEECNIVGREKAKLALAVCMKATNATMTRAGLTPEQAVFGKSLRWF